MLLRVTLGLKFKDTQCGFKAFTRNAAETLFPRQKIERWGFDPELLFLAQRCGLKVAEVPVAWAHSAGTRISPLKDGMKMFGVLDLETEMHGARFSIGLRNSHDKTMRLALTCGYRVFVCSNMAFSGDFTPVLAKHSKSFSLLDSISVGIDRMQRNFEPMRKQVETWRSSELTTVAAKMIIYEAFIESELEVPKHLARNVHDHYFNPLYDEFKARTIWSLSNAFTSAFKQLDPIPQFRATAKLAGFLEAAGH